MSEPTVEPLRKFVRAGAGAGKTWNLTREVIHLALDFRESTGQWPRTVLTTFTRKATQELKERLLIYCLEEKPEALDYVQSSSYLTITTMHGLFNQFLSRKGVCLGLPSQFKIVEGGQVDFWRKQILKDMLNEGLIGDELKVFSLNALLKNLKNYEEVYWQRKAQPIRYREQWEQLIESCFKEHWNTIEKMVPRLLSDSSEKWQEYGEQLQKLVSLYSTANGMEERQQSVLPVMSEIGKGPRKSKNHPGPDDTYKKPFNDSFDQVKKFLEDNQFSPKHWEKMSQTYVAFDSFAQTFMGKLVQRKIQEGALEANDLEYFTLWIMRDKPQVLDAYAQDINAWFIDEFQDTSPLQLEILDKMIGNNSVYLVGDPQQSIYLFRGSRSEVFFNKQQQMSELSGEIKFLKQNFRSQKNLLDFFNLFFTGLSESFSAMDAQVEAIEGQPAVEVSRVNPELEAGELALLSQQLQKILDEGANPRDIAILARTRSDLDRLLKELMTLGFPVISHSTGQFYERREILDGLSLLTFLVQPWDDKNIALLMRSPWLALSDQQVFEIINGAEKNHWLKFKEYFKSHPENTPGQCLLKAQEDVQQTGVSWVFRQLLFELGVLDYSQKIDGSGRREGNLWKLVNLVEKSAREPGVSPLQFVKEGMAAGTLEDFSETADAASPMEPNKINLMTIHASKGLQFDYVFLPFLHKKPRETTFQDFTLSEERALWSFRLPLDNSGTFKGGALEHLFVGSMRKREREEAQRVLYVAMTRAKKKLFMSWKGKTQSLSWGEMVENLWPQLGNRQEFVFQDIEECQKVESHWQNETYSIRAPWQEMKVTRGNEKSEDEAVITQWQDLMESQKHRRRGVVLHRVFEFLKEHGREQALALAERWVPSEMQDIEQALDFMLEHEELPFQDILDQGFVEWGYQHQQQDELKERRIDLWSVVDDVLWVVDYKTGNPSFKKKAMQQLQEYVDALKLWLDWQGEVRKVAVYPFSQKLFIES